MNGTMLFTRVLHNRLCINSLFNSKPLRFGPKCIVCSQRLQLKSYFHVGEIVEKQIPFKCDKSPTFGQLGVTNNIRTNILVISKATFSQESSEEVDAITYENVCEETLDSLCEFFEDIVEKFPALKSADVVFGDGVLTVNLEKFGTYVINRQSPNKQIWLSSPTSGPKRYDFVLGRKTWVYRHNNETLHSLLQQELSDILQNPVDLTKCAYSGSLE